MFYRKARTYSIKEIEKIKASAHILSLTMGRIFTCVEAGVPTKHIDRIAYETIKKEGGKPAFLNYHGYPATLCISVNNVVVHGIPNSYKLKKGDIVSIDCGVIYEGHYSDMAFTAIVGECDDPNKIMLLKATYQALMAGIQMTRPNNTTGDIGYSIQQVARKYNLGVVVDFCGHGIGSSLHEHPEVPNFGEPGKGTTLKPGMVICIEPMFSLGSGKVRVLPDGWTVVTYDGSLSAHYEHTVWVSEDGPVVLTTFDFIPENFRKFLI